ncbi:hypothetical protein VITFI_CDS2663 [Vitreoscilla filiformis]|uniref:Uncharacterized protein n=1 Tax=Vitreoscilla filiformis TaxID=63 RepID=A0A221KI19_VITFI|nr:hypothetical protein VITFI_CDS2663 [Vitreoscilla filiformis]
MGAQPGQKTIETMPGRESGVRHAARIVPQCPCSNRTGSIGRSV